MERVLLGQFPGQVDLSGNLIVLYPHHKVKSFVSLPPGISATSVKVHVVSSYIGDMWGQNNLRGFLRD